MQNFVSAAAGMAVVVAIIRGITRRGQRTLGNFWVDLTRTTLRILLPLSFVIAVLLSLGGVVQNLNGYTDATTVDAAVAAEVTQSIPGGPVASQIAIKQLGTNGGGFYNANSAHPFENPHRVHELHRDSGRSSSSRWRWSSTFGVLIGSKKQARVLLAVMVAIWIVDVGVRDRRRAGGQPEPHRARRRSVLVGRAQSAATWRARRSDSGLRRAVCGPRPRLAHRTAR